MVLRLAVAAASAAAFLVTAYCNGERFPDGSYWHQTGFMRGMLQPLGWNPPFCVDAAGVPAPGLCAP